MTTPPAVWTPQTGTPGGPLYDSTGAIIGPFATITLPSTITGVVPFTLPYNVAFSTGLTIVTSGATDITVSYS